MLKIDNRAHYEVVGRSTRTMQDYLRRVIVEMSEEKVKLEGDKISAEERERDLEQEMERWITDINYERFTSNASIKNLSECLDKEKLHRMKSDVTIEIVEKEREKIGSSFIEAEDRCKKLEVDLNVKEARIQELEEVLKETDVEIKLMATELEKEKNERRNIEEQKEQLKLELNEGKILLLTGFIYR